MNPVSATKSNSGGKARPRVLLGPLASDPAESVSAVNRAFRQGLTDRYEFCGLAADRTRGGTRQARLNATNAFYFVRQFFQWAQILRTQRPALAHYAISSGWGMEKGLVFMAMARRYGARTLAHLHSGGFPDHWAGLSEGRRSRAAREFAKLDGLVLASDWWRQEIGKHLPLPPEKLFTVNNPVDEQFEKAGLGMPIERDGQLAFGMGVMSRAKGLFDILEAARKLSGVIPLKIAVAGAEREPNVARDARQFLSEHKLEKTVELRTSISLDEKMESFRKASILLLPSYYENFPLVVLEAAAAGMAIISTPVGAVPEFFEDGVSALFVRAGQPDQIANALKRLYLNPQERLQIAAAARKTFLERLTRTQIMNSLDSVYQRVLRSPR